MMPFPPLPGPSTRRALIVLAAATLAACGLSRPAVVKETFLLQAPAATAVTATPRPSTLKVGSVAVAAPFRGRSLVYRETDLKFESDFYNEFFVAPSAMLTEGVGAYLGGAGVFREVLPAGANADGDYVLEAFVSELYGDYRDAARPAAVITARFFLIDNRTTTGVPIWQAEFSQRVPLSTRSPEALAAGLNTAWGALLGELARALATAKPGR